MTYTVLITDPALDELNEAYDWLLERTPQHAPIWFNRIVDAMLSLDTNPARCPLVGKPVEGEREVRQLLYGDKSHAYRILFNIRGPNVHVLHIRHASREF